MKKYNDTPPEDVDMAHCVACQREIIPSKSNRCYDCFSTGRHAPVTIDVKQFDYKGSGGSYERYYGS